MSDINHGAAIVCFQAMVSLLQFEFPSFRFDKGGLFILNVIVADTFTEIKMYEFDTM